MALPQPFFAFTLLSALFVDRKMEQLKHWLQRLKNGGFQLRIRKFLLRALGVQNSLFPAGEAVCPGAMRHQPFTVSTHDQPFEDIFMVARQSGFCYFVPKMVTKKGISVD